MTQEKKPLGVSIVATLMTVVSFWWLALGLMYFFGSWYWLFYEGIPFVWMWGIIYGFMGFVGLGIAGGLAMGLRQAWTITLIIAILDVVFSLPSIFNGYGIIGAILSASVVVILFTPSVRAYFKHESLPENAEYPTRT